MSTGKELDMGSPFDYFGEISHPDYKNINELAGNVSGKVFGDRPL
jgi:D-alanyl-D-alanine dipeptidase